jgi:hypothetical protein
MVLVILPEHVLLVGAITIMVNVLSLIAMVERHWINLDETLGRITSAPKTASANAASAGSRNGSAVFSGCQGQMRMTDPIAEFLKARWYDPGLPHRGSNRPMLLLGEPSST